MNQNEQNALAAQICSRLTSKAERQPGAILLTGGWGSGKTHFWQKHIRNKLKSHEVVYQSLFGISSADDLRSSLMTSFVSGTTDTRTSTKVVFQNLFSIVVKTGKYIGNEVLKAKAGVDVSQILSGLQIKVDVLQIFPENAIICFDDLERCSINIDETLGVLNYLIEHKSARVLIIANEDYLKDTSIEPKERARYEKFKEKVVWISHRFSQSLEEVASHFVDLLATESEKAIRSYLPTVLETFKRGDCSNLRTLQKVIRFIDEILAVENLELPEESVQFLVALVIEDSQHSLDEDSATYRGFKHRILGKDKKEDELAGPEKISCRFYKTFFETEALVGFSAAIFSLVKTGVLDREAFIEEFNPDGKEYPKGIKLLREVNSEYLLFKNDSEAGSLLKKIVSHLETVNEEKPDVYVHLLQALFHLSRQLEEPISSQLIEAAKAKLKGITNEVNTITFRSFEMEMRIADERDFLKPFLELYVTERNNRSATLIRKQIIADLEKGNVVAMDMLQVPSSVDVSMIYLSSDVLRIVDSKLHTNGKQHFRYYQSLIHGFKQRGDERDSLLPIVRNHLVEKMETAPDRSSRKRLAKLIEFTNTTGT